MELGDFVSETLKQIFDGIKKAQKYAEDVGGAINPKDLQYLVKEGGEVQHKPTSRIGTMMEFHLELTELKQKGKKGSGRIGVRSLVSRQPSIVG